MFSAIAPTYDLNNHLHSLWLDGAWRRKAAAIAQIRPTDTVADIACGTGDLALAFSAAGARRVIGIDFCHAMICGAKAKSFRQLARAPVAYSDGDATRLPLADQSVDVVSIAFGIRNVDQWRLAIKEFFRVLKPGGRLIILEFATPRNAVVHWLFNIYFRRIMPATASFISGDRTGAYHYLPASVDTFATPESLAAEMTDTGFTAVTRRSLTFGICICYRGVRRG